MLDANDSATLIANVGTLPDGTEITWKTAPKFDNDGILNNTPVISVKEPDKAELEVTLTDEDCTHQAMIILWSGKMSLSSIR